MPRSSVTAPTVLSPSPERQTSTSWSRTDRGDVERSKTKLERAPAPLYLLGKRAGCGRPPSPGARVRHSTSGPRRRRAGRGRRDSRAREGRDAPGRWAIGGRRPRSATAHPLKGRAATASSMAPLDMGIATRPQRARVPVTAALPPAQAIDTDTARRRCPARQQ